MNMEKVGEIAFLAFVVIAILAGLARSMNVAAPYNEIGVGLVVLGIIVGFLNISEKETTPFLVASIALLAAGAQNFAALPVLGPVVANILYFIGIFVAPGAVIVALKAVNALGKSK